MIAKPADWNHGGTACPKCGGLDREQCSTVKLLRGMTIEDFFLPPRALGTTFICKECGYDEFVPCISPE